MSSTRTIQEILPFILNESRLTDASLITLSMTCHGMQRLIPQLLIENMLTSGILNSEILATSFLFPFLYAGEQCNEEILKIVLSSIGFLTQKANYNLEVIESTINIINNSPYKNKSHYRSVFCNLGFFGNKEVLELMLDTNRKVPANLDCKIKDRIQSDMRSDKIASANRYLETYEVLIENKIKFILNSILNKIKEHSPILNGGGDTSILEIDHPIPKQAAKVYKLIVSALHSEDSLIDSYAIINELVLNKLSTTRQKGLITRYGERDSSTTNLYSNIIREMAKGMEIIRDIVMLKEDLNRLINKPQRHEVISFS